MTLPLIWSALGWSELEDTMSFDGGSLLIDFNLWVTDINNKKLRNITDSIIDGNVTLDVSRDIFLSATFTLQDPAQVIPYVEYLAPFINITYEDGREYVHQQMGLYCTRVSPSSITVEQSNGTIEGSDLCTVLAEDHFTNTYNIASGTNVVTAVQAIVVSAGITRMTIPSTSKTLPSKQSFAIGTDKLSACNKLLKSIGFFELCTSADGFISSPGKTRPIKSTEPWKTFTEDDIMGPVELAPTNDRIANVVIVTNSDTNTAPLKSVKRNDDPSSPTSTVSINRQIVKTEQLSGKVIQEDLDARATLLLERGRTYYRTATIHVLPDPGAFDVHQTVDLDFDENSELEFLSGRWWITTASLGFTAANALLELTINQLTRRGNATEI